MKLKLLMLGVLSVLVVMCGATAFAQGTIRGIVYDSGGTPVSGATVNVLSVGKATTDSKGSYAITAPAGTYSVAAYDSNHYTQTQDGITVLNGEESLVDFYLMPMPEPTYHVVDNFDRVDSGDLGTSTDPDHWSWFRSQSDAQIKDNMLHMPHGGNVGPYQNTAGSAFMPSDFDLTVTVLNTTGINFAIGYRQNGYGDPGWGNGGYLSFIFPVQFGSGVTLFASWLGHVWQVPQGGLVRDWSVPHTVRVRVIGNHHEAWLDTDKIIDYFDNSGSAKNGEGYVYVTTSEPSTSVINFKIDAFECKAWGAPTRYITGTVTDAANSSKKIAGATVRAGSIFATTDANGKYSLAVIADGTSYDVVAYADDYRPSAPVTVTPDPGSNVTQDIALDAIPPASTPDLLDTFSRDNGPNLGVSEDTNHWNYFQTQYADEILDGMVSMPNGGNVGPYAKSDGTLFQPADFDSTMTVTNPEGKNFAFGYRQGDYAEPGYGNGGYLVFFFGDGRVSLFAPWIGHAFGTPLNAANWALPHKLRVRVSGSHHMAWFDGQKVIDYYDASAMASTGGGYLYLTSSDAGGDPYPLKLDDLVISTSGRLFAPGTISGTVTVANDATKKVVGAVVQVGSKTATTDANGMYSVAVDVGPLTTYDVSATAEGYRPSAVVAVEPIAGGNKVHNIALVPIQATSAPDVLDTFSRGDNIDLGRTEDANHWSYVPSETAAGAAIDGGAVWLPGGFLSIDQKADGSTFSPADFEAVATAVSASSTMAFRYRTNSTSDSNWALGGYLAFVTPTGMTGVWSAWTGHQWGTGITAPNLTVPHKLKLRVFGNHHQMWFDDQKVVDWYDTTGSANNGGGYIGLCTDPGSYPIKWDNIAIAKDAYVMGPGTISGTVTDAANPAKRVAGATVSISGWLVTADANGFYTATVDAGLGMSYSVRIWGDDYFPDAPVDVTPIAGGNKTRNAALNAIPVAAAPDVLDTFSRVDGANLGFTEDTNHWSYAQSEGGATATLSGGVLDMPLGGNVGPDRKADGTTLRPADFDASVTVWNLSGGWVHPTFAYR